MSYSEQFVRGLEWLWGEGFLSPGGPSEIQNALQGTDICSKKVLDFGCGIGGIDRLLISQFGARKVVAIDVEAQLISRAKNDAQRLGYSSEQIEYELVTPGRLDFPDESFDIVFTKDVIVHIEDKGGIYENIFRVLRSGGTLVGGDWIGSDDTSQSERVKEWLDFAKLEFFFWTSSEMRELLIEIGFQSVHTIDRNHWYRQSVRDEIATVSGVNRNKFIEMYGEEQADNRLRSSTLKMKAVDAGELRPTIFKALKP